MSVTSIMPILIAEATGISGVTTAVGNALTIAGTAISYCMDNPVLAVCVGASIAGIGFGLFRKARRSVN